MPARQAGMMVERRRHKLVVPDVVGLQWENAAILLRNKGFGEPEIRFTEAYQPIDTVVSQRPLKGQLAPSGESVVLEVSKQSVSRFLPSVFQTTDSGADPSGLRNFLWIFQEIYDGISRRVERVHEEFSPYTAGEEFLPWLAQWIAMTLDADWPVVKKRQMLRTAAELYPRRGTAGAITRLLEIFTDVRPELIENAWPYNGFWVGVYSSVGIDTVVLPPVNLAHCFVVRFPMSYDELGEQKVARIHQIIRAEKPAHTVYFLEFADEAAPGVSGEAGDDVSAVGVAPGGDSAADGGSAEAAPGDAAGEGAGEGAGAGQAPGAETPTGAAVGEASDDEHPGVPMGIGVAAALAEEEDAPSERPSDTTNENDEE